MLKNVHFILRTAARGCVCPFHGQITQVEDVYNEKEGPHELSKFQGPMRSLVTKRISTTFFKELLGDAR